MELEYIIHCYRCVQYRIDKAIDTLKTHNKHKHTECIALNVRFVIDKPQCDNSHLIVFFFSKAKFSPKLTWDCKNIHLEQKKMNINTIFIAFVSILVLRCF